MPVTGLPDFPWDSLRPYAQRARQHPDGVVDLSVGTPVDATPALLQQVLADAADAPGYPTVAGTEDVHDAVAAWFERVRGTGPLPGLGVMPVIGSKELVAWLPTLLGLGAGDTVVHPEIAYPTYDVGARLAGATPVAADATTALGPDSTVRLVWLNSPGNPTGQVLGVEHLAKVVAWARSRGAVVASDECYCDLGWHERWDPSVGGERVPSVLDPRVTGGDLSGVLAVCSASKRSNLAGYRAAFVAGDPVLVERLVQVRKHAGMIVPAPVQAVLVASLREDSHVAEQKARYRARRDVLLPAVEQAGLRVDGSEAGLYLWVTDPAAPAGSDGWDLVARLAELGVLVAPGSFYGPRGARHVRMALTAPDERVRAAARRLTPAGPGTNR
ncbi:succinyldiaminopimelate transaminase [Aquipuribacter sp. MA13-6]|uniref:succinyldiaminopimelate transaminase n=1 Tax=unclassified Aquipuribacter TaxID=2635084 RepID=UPI003EEBE2A8